MKRLYTLFFAIFCIFSSNAQNMSVESFGAVLNDLDARVNYPKYDPNNRKAALIKIETTLKGFAFDVGQLGIVDVDQSKVAQVWVYIPAGAIRIKIHQQQLGVLEYEFPEAIKEATVYQMHLTSNTIHTVVEQDAGGQYFIVRTEPDDVECQLTVDSDSPISFSGGECALFLPYGTHSYTISSDLYTTYSGSVEIGSEAVEQSVELVANFGYINIASQPSAAVYINNIKVGQTPYKSDMLPLGRYQVRVSAPNHDDFEQSVELVQGGERVQVNAELPSYLSDIQLSTSMADASIYVNNDLKGKGQWSGHLMPGTYQVEVSKAGHRSTKRVLTVVRNIPQRVVLDAPTPMYGSLNVNPSQVGTMVSVDGVEIGKAPNIFSKILVGEHRITYTKKGYKIVTEIVNVAEGRITNLQPKLEKVVAATTAKPYTPSYTNPHVTPYTRRYPSSSKERTTFRDYVRYGVGADLLMGSLFGYSYSFDLLFGTPKSKFKYSLGYTTTTLGDAVLYDLKFKQRSPTISVYRYYGAPDFLAVVLGASFQYNFNSLKRLSFDNEGYYYDDNYHMVDVTIDSPTMNRSNMTGTLSCGFGAHKWLMLMYWRFDITSLFDTSAMVDMDSYKLSDDNIYYYGDGKYLYDDIKSINLVGFTVRAYF